MNSRERVLNQIAGKPVDRIPLVGGWFHGVENLAELVGMSVENYLAEPVKNLVEANRVLPVDAMITPLVPESAGQVRTMHVLEESRADMSPEMVKAAGEAVPSDDEVLASFDFEEEERVAREEIETWQAELGDIVWIPTFWEITPAFELFDEWGYGAYFSAMALYPEAVGRIYRESAILAKARGEIIVRLYDEYDLPRICFMGPDMCTNKGPMCSPAFLRAHYFPLVKECLAQFVDAGIRVIRHCDGDVMPIIDDFIDCGYAGFQGFQYECGVDPWQIAARRSATGEELIFFAGLNVTHTLPFGSIADVAEEIEYVLDFTGGGKRLFFFTSSAIGPEAPLENTTYAYRRMAAGDYGRSRSEASLRKTWPWAQTGRA